MITMEGQGSLRTMETFPAVHLRMHIFRIVLLSHTHEIILQVGSHRQHGHSRVTFCGMYVIGRGRKGLSSLSNHWDICYVAMSKCFRVASFACFLFGTIDYLLLVKWSGVSPRWRRSAVSG